MQNSGKYITQIVIAVTVGMGIGTYIYFYLSDILIFRTKLIKLLLKLCKAKKAFFQIKIYFSRKIFFIKRNYQ